MTNIISEAVKLLQNNQAQKAEELLQPHSAANAENASFLHIHGLAAADCGDYASGIARLEKAIALNPRVAEYHHNLGSIYRMVGKFDLSEEQYRTAIKFQPEYAEAYFNYSAAKKFTVDDPIIPQLEQQLTQSELSDEDRCFLGFAAGKIFNDIKEYEKAFSFYELGNRSKRAQFDIDKFRQSIVRVITVFSKELIQQKMVLGSSSQVPVFIVGMPRTGTTLVEQILSSHPEIHGAGELPDIASISGTMQQHASKKSEYPECIKYLPENVFSGFANAYLRRLRTFDHSAVRIIDKLPQNFLYLGLITMMFPQAKIIHCQRHPLDTCLSCFFQRFRRGHDYSYDLTDLGLFYREYERLMQHWSEVLPGMPYNLQYSDLVTRQEEISRELLDFVEMPWDDRCLNFHDNNRPVKTASNWQVRRPMNRSGLERWKNYDQFLQPLRDVLELS